MNINGIRQAAHKSSRRPLQPIDHVEARDAWTYACLFWFVTSILEPSYLRSWVTVSPKSFSKLQ